MKVWFTGLMLSLGAVALAAGCGSDTRQLSVVERAQLTCNEDAAAKCTICHQTGSATNPWVLITISDHAAMAHEGHEDRMPVNGSCAVGPCANENETYTDDRECCPGLEPDPGQGICINPQ